MPKRRCTGSKRTTRKSHSRKRKMTYKKRRGGANIKKVKTLFPIYLVPYNEWSTYTPYTEVPTDQTMTDIVLEYYNKLGKGNKSDDILIGDVTINDNTGHKRIIKLSDIVKNIQYTPMPDPNSSSILRFTLTFDVDIDSLWNARLFDLTNNTYSAKEEYGKDLLSIIYECINKLINDNGYLEYMIANSTTDSEVYLQLHGIDYKGVKYIPRGQFPISSDSLYPMADDLVEFFSPYIQS